MDMRMIDAHPGPKQGRVTSIIPLLLTGLLILAGCAHAPRFRYPDSPATLALLEKYVPRYPNTRFIVASDLHFYDTALGAVGSDFTAYVTHERKLLVESNDILETFIREVSSVEADFVLVPGDLTKDGEQANHRRVAAALARIEAGGKKVYVINGNHDIDNPRAFRYTAAGKERIASVSASEFAALYGEFGWNESFARDAASLSYAARPVPGLVLLALDACRYRENPGRNEAVTAGLFQNETFAWIESRLEEAARNNEAVIVMMHHGVIEHFEGQEKHFGEYLVESWRNVSELFSAYRVRLAFTGHYHAQDIVLRRNEKDAAAYLFDVETGSLVTFPCPYRVVALSGNQADITTRFITSLPSQATGFPEKARALTEEGLKNAAIATMKKYGVPGNDADTLAPQIVAAFMAHYRGDESLPAGREMLKEKGLSLMGGIIVGARRDLVIGLWHDLAPADNDVLIDLATGEYRAR
jgi:hypothetical protein